VIKFSDVKPEFVHFCRDLGAPYTGTGAIPRLCVALAAALFNAAQQQYDFGLPPFYSQEWKKGADGNSSHFVSGLPPNHQAAAHAARLLDGDASTKEFLCEIHSFRRNLANTNHLLVGGGTAKNPASPSVFVDSDGSITINDSGEISKLDFSHDSIIVTVSTGYKYFYDREAVLEPSVTRDARHPYISRGAKDLDGRPSEQWHGGEPRSSLPACYKGSTFDRGKTAEHQLGRAQEGGRRELVISADRKDLPTAIHSRHRSPIPGGQSLQQAPTPGRNLRDVWTIPTQPYKEAHFATFPERLIEPCILAGTSERGCCPKCGAPWVRILERGTVNLSNAAKAGTDIEGKGHPSSQVRDNHDVRDGPTALVTTLGWRPGCACNAPPGVHPEDLDVIRSPLCRGQDREDPTLEVGRAGY
jgi:hypothetical protein